MRVKMTDKGRLVISAESGAESFALQRWGAMESDSYIEIDLEGHPPKLFTGVEIGTTEED